MKKLFKILLGLVAALVLLMVLAGVLLPYFFDKEDLKKAISAKVHDQTGRELSINGELDFSVFPWLAVEVSDLSLGNAPGFGDQAQAQIGKARVGVALMPLLHRQISVDEITLDGLQLSLAVNQKGQNNWDDLSSGKAPAQDGETEPGMFSTQRIAGLNIRNANVEYKDSKSGSHYRLSGFSMKTGALGGGKPVPLELQASLEDVVAATRADVELMAVAAIDLKAEQYTLEDVDLTVALDLEDQKQSIRIRAPQLELDLAAQSLRLPEYTGELANLRADGTFSADRILDGPVFNGRLNIAEFSPVKLMQTLAMEVPATADPQVLQSADFSAELSGSSTQLTLQSFALQLDQSRITGRLNVANYDRPNVGFSLVIDEIDLDRYMEPANGDAAGTTGDVAMPKDELKGLEVQGDLQVGALRMAGLEFSDARLGVAIKDGRLRLHPLAAGFYGGQYNGDVVLDGSGALPVISLDEKVESISFQRLVADLVETESLSGEAQGHVRLSGRGNTSGEVLGSLQGDLGLALTDGALEGINIWYEIRRGWALYKGLPAPEPEPKRTAFSRMQMTGTVEDGVVTTRELTADLPFLTVNGNGAIDLGQSKLDLALVAKVRDTLELANDPLGSGLSGKSLPFKISGPLDAPSLSVDWEGLLKSQATDLLLKKIGLGAQDEPAVAPEGEQEESSSKNKLEETAKGVLSGLLGKKNKDKEKDQDPDDG
jgi:AsmA protein